MTGGQVMKIGFFSDVHGDLGSLQAAIDLFGEQGIDEMVCAGDLVEKGREHDQVVALIRQLEIPCVKGNHDENAVRHHRLRQVVGDDETPLQTATIDYLEGLPDTCRRLFATTSTLVTHATVSHNAGRVFHEDGDSRLAKRFKKDLAKTDCELIVVGHTHSPFDVTYRGKRVINPGACCSLKGRDSHTVGIFDFDCESFTVFGIADRAARPIYQASVD